MSSRQGGTGGELRTKRPEAEVSLPEVLWGREIRWGLEARGDPRDRAGLSVEDGVRCWAGDTASSLGEKELGTGRTLQSHSPFLQGARGGHRHPRFPVGETESEEFGGAEIRGRPLRAPCQDH